MNLYETLRHFADSWGLLALALVFLAIVLWAFRPGSKRAYRDQADIPFKYDPEDRNRE
ncbi:cbb3-type cytochrome c oxidase subunit 3 [Antarcticirhabdus aurantiaca]|uniref:Cbb3-type cytochrome c oxidase subunit 3 n=1 Tax=Antarcticirhabdus aurantiaca TaxID=2606717 RepID=A0ACD4NRC2_9HYPH|nr:cbb3-type cytochrome c oxidase subunit 3 [Antarcticirhabdus aurantiaca]WAJ29500.1 cbb3-type cytochrome c oxidase subunit 3 [Jeongeuplla avenae]